MKIYMDECLTKKKHLNTTCGGLGFSPSFSCHDGYRNSPGNSASCSLLLCGNALPSEKNCLKCNGPINTISAVELNIPVRE